MEKYKEEKKKKKKKKKIHLLNFDEDDFEITSQVFFHPEGEIWHISSCPAREDYFFTCYNAGN